MIRRRTFVAGSLSLVAAPLAARARLAGTVDASLMFFEVAERAEANSSNSYEPLVLPSGTEVSVARTPALIFQTGDVVSVVIKRKRSGGTSGQQHTAIITLRPDAAAQLRQFSERNLGKRVDIRLTVNASVRL